MDTGRAGRILNEGRWPVQLAVLGALAERLSPEDLGRTLNEAVEVLREATGADDCEILLREPDGGDMIVTACCGTDRDALMERLRFAAGEGYPGMVATTGVPQSTRCLSQDPRFLRRGVPGRGIAAFLSAPLHSAGQPLGCVSLAWRDADAPMAAAAELVARACAPLASAVRAGLLAARESMDRAMEEAGADVAARSRACLAALVRASGARSGVLVLYGADGTDTTIFKSGSTAEVCADALDGRTRCRTLGAGHGVLLHGERSEWPHACRHLPGNVVAPICLPLRAERRLRGVVVLDRPDMPVPPTHDLVLLLTMAAEAAARLGTAPQQSARRAQHTRGAPLLEIRCFGRFDVRLDGEPIPEQQFARRKALTLLKVLILNGGRPVSRDALVERLWAEADIRSGANRLHGVVHALRSVIEPYRDRRRWLYVCNGGDVYYFNVQSPHWVDLYEFRREAAGADELERLGRHDDAIRLLESALELYRGELFADEPYARWCDLERAELRNRYVDLAARVADLWTAQGSVERAVVWLRRGLVVDALREDMHQRLMRALIEAGRRDEALVQYRICARLLYDELGASPAPETRRLEQLAASSASH